MNKLKHLQRAHRQPALALMYCGMSLETIEAIIEDKTFTGALEDLNETLTRVVIAQHEAKAATLTRF